MKLNGRNVGSFVSRGRHSFVIGLWAIFLRRAAFDLM